MSDLVLRLARPGEDARIADFINQNFDMRLPLINRADFYQFYYAHTPGAAPQFALAEQDGEILCAAGYILANQSETPDVWVSVGVAAKGHNGVGLELMDALSGLLNARVVACNNIRANTCVLYHFLGWQAERLPHYYRLGAPGAKGWQLAVPGPNSAPLPVQDDLPLTRVPDTAALAALGLPHSSHTPHKDLWYLQRRYFAYPHQSYDVWAVQEGKPLNDKFEHRRSKQITRELEKKYDLHPAERKERTERPELKKVDYARCLLQLPFPVVRGI